MSTPKYLTIFQKMVDENKEVFDKLKDPKIKKDELESVRMQALRIIHKSENILCARSESTKFSKFSMGLADKFWAEIRSQYPQIDDSVTIQY